MSSSFEADRLCKALETVDPDFADPQNVKITSFLGGASNLTALLQAGSKSLVVRRAPPRSGCSAPGRGPRRRRLTGANRLAAYILGPPFPAPPPS